MKFGLHHASWLDDAGPAEAFEAARRKALWAEEQGFAWFSVQDHVIQTPRQGVPEEPVLEGWAVLAALAAVTTRIRLGMLASAVGFRNPAHLAKIAATVDLISRGRLTLGLGAGFYEAEYSQYGWDFPPLAATRIAQMAEAAELILKLWTLPRTTFDGRYFRVREAILEPKPVPRPPLLIAGGGEQLTLRVVARLADACNFSGGDPAEIRHTLDVLRRHCDAAGRDFAAIEKTYVRSWSLARDAAAAAAKRARSSSREPGFGFFGTPQEMVDLIGQYATAGIDMMIIGERNDTETLALFESEVMPHFG